MTSTSTILLVDDDPAVLEALGALLNASEYRLAFATDGAQALDKAAELMPDLILLDISMPVMGGFEVCERLRADPVLAEVPIIIVTALDDRDSRLRGIQVGADDFLSKPFDRVELRARVQTILRLNRYRRLLSERMRFAWVVEQADDGYLTVDTQDTILYANRQARLYLGLPEDEHEPLPGTFLELAHRQYHSEPPEAWEGWPGQSTIELMRSRYLVQPETPTTRAFWLQVDLLDMPSGPNPARLVRLRDVTTRMATQRDLRKFHSVISHKLRTPLVGIVGGLEMLIQHAPRLSGPEVAHFAQVALRGAQRLRGEIDDILNYLSVPALARAGGAFRLSELPGLVTEVGTSLGLEAVAVSGDAECGAAALSLSRQGLEAILWEVLENSKKFHPQRAPRVEVLVSISGARAAKIQILDDGVVLTPEQLSKVWSPYYQGEKYFTGEATGMGLGLPTVASLVWEVGGAYRVFNREGQPGVVVELVVPLAEQQAEVSASS